MNTQMKEYRKSNPPTGIPANADAMDGKLYRYGYQS